MELSSYVNQITVIFKVINISRSKICSPYALYALKSGYMWHEDHPVRQWSSRKPGAILDIEEITKTYKVSK